MADRADEIGSGMGHLLAGWSPEVLDVFTLPMDAEVLVFPETRVSLLP